MNVYISILLSLAIPTTIPAIAAKTAKTPAIELSVDLSSHANDISPNLYGIFFEEINHAGEGGLYAELLQNRSFEDCVIPEGYHVANGALVPFETLNYITGKPTVKPYRWVKGSYPGWEIIKNGNAEASAITVTDNPNFATAPTSLKLDITNHGAGVSLINEGFWGVPYKNGATYRLRLFMRTNNGNGEMTARLLDDNGNEIGQKKLIVRKDGKWNEYTAVITASGNASAGKFAIDLPSSGTYYFDYVSLFPTDTFKGRKNGLRKDVATMLEELNPAFVRWPGGCVVEGITLNNRLDWKKTLGDPASRPGEYDTWGYRNSYGFGYKEFLDFCEDIGAKAMYVCNVGLSCYGRSGEYSSEEEIPFYIQEALDAIEYALGDTNTKWGAIRASEGHAAPYPLEYVEIGNENFGEMYDHRYRLFYEAIKAKWPQLTLISNYGLEGSEKAGKIDMVDPHWYVKPEHFFNTTELLDSYDRSKPAVYVGEYSCNENVGGGNMLAALSEAALLTGLERNADIVKMASYAPLLENKNDRAWPVNLIWMSTDKTVGRSSYYVQKLFSNNRPTYNLSAKARFNSEIPREPFINYDSYVGFGTWSTQDQFRHLMIIDADGTKHHADMNDPSQWVNVRGKWISDDHVYTQTTGENRTALIWTGAKVNAGSVIEFEVRKLTGNEGFLAYFGLTSPNLSNGYMLNAGGWNNTASAIEKLTNDSSSPITPLQQGKIDAGRWHRIRLEITESGVDYYLDCKKIMSFLTNPIDKKDGEDRKFYAVGYDEPSGEVVIKIVNPSNHSSLARIKFTKGNVESTGEITVLGASSPEDENSFENPSKIMPETFSYDKFAPQFDYTLSPNSLTIFRIKKQ